MDFLKFKLMRQDFKDAKTAWTPAMGSFYALKFGGIDGKEVDFATYKGHVTVVMNVACFCGYTAGSYPALQKIYDKYKARGFTAIGFPCNQFGAQEPGTDKEIAETAKTMNVTFPLVTKSDVNGPHTNVVYQFLKKCFPGDVLWNFATKWVINRAGVPVRRFEKESWEEIDAYVAKLLDEPVPGAPAAAAAPAAGAGAAAAPAAAAPAAGAGTDAAK